MATTRKHVKTKNIKDLAKTVEAFCADQKIRIKHTQALELAARLKGSRDLHEAQQTSEPTVNGTRESLTSGPITEWQHLFENVDDVGQSEFRALSELFADALNIHNIGGEVDGDTPLPDDDIDHINSMCSEVIDWAKSFQSRIATAKGNTEKQVEPTVYNLGGNNETITVKPFEIRSTIVRDKDNELAPWNVATATLESLLLAMASEGIQMDTPAMHKAVATTNDFLINAFGDE